MGLAGKYNLYGSITVAHDAGEALDIGEEEVGTLIGGEATRKADRQNVWIEEVIRLAKGVW